MRMLSRKIAFVALCGAAVATSGTTFGTMPAEAGTELRAMT